MDWLMSLSVVLFLSDGVGLMSVMIFVFRKVSVFLFDHIESVTVIGVHY